MFIARSTLALMGLLLAAACRPDTVLLAYSYPEATSTSYDMRAEARASWDIAETGPENGSYSVEYLVTETVTASGEDDATVVVEMDPVSVSADGLPAPDRGVRSFTLRLGKRGEVLEILEVDGVPAAELEPDEIAFIGTYRPPLPVDPVAIGESWQSQQEFRLESVFQQLVTVGALQRLNRDAAGPHAALTYRGSGPLVWSIDLPGGRASLTGTASTSSWATLDLAVGALREAESQTSGDFRVRVIPNDEVSSPLIGTLSFDIRVRLAAHKPAVMLQPVSSSPTTT